MIWMWFECVQSIVVCSVYTVSCFEVKIEADSNDITECPHADKHGTGMFGFSFKYV